MRTLQRLSAVSIAALALSLGHQAQAQEYSFRAALGTPPDHPLTISLNTFADLVEERSEGAISIEVFDSGRLGANELDSAAVGTVEIVVSTPSNMAQYYPPIAILELPYLFESPEHMLAVTRGDAGAEIAELFEESAGLVILGYFGGAERNMITVDTPVESIDDLSGLRMRTFQSEQMINWWASLGAVGSVVPFAEVYTALQTGVIDGAENEYTTFVTSRWAEVAKNIALTRHNITVRPLLINAETFHSLPEDLQEIVRQAGLDAADSDVELERRLDTENRDRLVADFGVTITSPDTAPFIERSRFLVDDFADEHEVHDLVDLIRAAAE